MFIVAMVPAYCVYLQGRRKLLEMVVYVYIYIVYL